MDEWGLWTQRSKNLEERLLAERLGRADEASQRGRRGDPQAGEWTVQSRMAGQVDE